MANLFTRSTEFDPLNDFLFLKVMGEKGSEVQLLGFINAVLGKSGDDRFTSVEILENRTFLPEVPGSKTCILDVRALLHNNTKVNVEVQLQNQHNIDRRSLFYLCKEYSESLSAGQDYVELPDIIGINIINFDYLQTKHFHSCFRLREDTEKDIVLTKSLEIHYLNMVKYRKQGNRMLSDPLHRWLTWFDRDSPQELVTEVVKMDAAIKTANERMAQVTEDKEAMRAYWRHQMALSDRTAELNYVRDEGHEQGRAIGLTQGLAQGREEGRETEKLEIAKNLAAAGISEDVIFQTTGVRL